MTLEGKSVLLCDDDDPFRSRLTTLFAQQGASVQEVSTVSSAKAVVLATWPDLAVIDLRLPDESGLALVKFLVNSGEQVRPPVKIVVLTGYGTISTAVDAIRSGAKNYLQKPTSFSQIVTALMGESSLGITTSAGIKQEVTTNLPTLAEVEEEYVHRVLHESDGNVTRTASILGIDRRSLQRRFVRTAAAIRKPPR